MTPNVTMTPVTSPPKPPVLDYKKSNNKKIFDYAPPAAPAVPTFEPVPTVDIESDDSMDIESEHSATFSDDDVFGTDDSPQRKATSVHEVLLSQNADFNQVLQV